jgi:large subunit ribosomal protein L13
MTTNNTTIMKKEMYTIDATGKKLGRIASEAAACLMGKKTTAFTKNAALPMEVRIVNAKRTDISAHKKNADVYVTYTGFRGGLNSEKLGDLMIRRGMEEVYKRAVYNMLPKNKLRALRMKNLIITD